MQNQEWERVIEVVYAIAQEKQFTVIECIAAKEVQPYELRVLCVKPDASVERAVFQVNDARVGGACKFGCYEPGENLPFCGGNTGPGFSGWEQTIRFALEAIEL